MGMIASTKQTLTKDDRPEVLSDPGGGYNLSMPQFSDPGDDSRPLPGDYVAGVSTQKTGSAAAVGFSDDTERKAAEGEKRIYSRDANGAVIAEIWLKNDGSVLIKNDNVTIELKADGTVLIHNVEIKTGDIIDKVKDILSDVGTFAKSLTVNSIEVHAHTHNVTAVGSPTGPMLSGTPAP